MYIYVLPPPPPGLPLIPYYSPTNSPLPISIDIDTIFRIMLQLYVQRLIRNILYTELPTYFINIGPTAPAVYFCIA